MKFTMSRNRVNEEMVEAVVGTALFASGAANAVTARNMRGITSDYARCAAKRGADAAARRPYQEAGLLKQRFSHWLPPLPSAHSQYAAKMPSASRSKANRRIP